VKNEGLIERAGKISEDFPKKVQKSFLILYLKVICYKLELKNASGAFMAPRVYRVSAFTRYYIKSSCAKRKKPVGHKGLEGR
jgi:hypothetical protein